MMIIVAFDSDDHDDHGDDDNDYDNDFSTKALLCYGSWLKRVLDAYFLKDVWMFPSVRVCVYIRMSVYVLWSIKGSL